MGIDGRIYEDFRRYKFTTADSLPKDQDELEALVQYSVRNIHRFPAQASGLLRNVEPEISGRLLTTALKDPKRIDLVKSMFNIYGPRPVVVNLLAGVLEYDELRPHAYDILETFGPTNTTVKALVRAVSSYPGCREPAVELMKIYGPSRLTIKYLVEPLSDPKRRASVIEVLEYYSTINKRLVPIVEQLKRNGGPEQPITTLCQMYRLKVPFYLRRERSTNHFQRSNNVP